MTKLPTYPNKTTLRDRAHDALQDTGVPLVGSIVRQSFEPPLQKRRVEWFAQLEAMLNKHEEKIKEISNTHESRIDEVVSLLSQTYNPAMRTHVSEKRQYLLSALENAILTDIDYDLAAAFIRIIDELQPIHMKIMAAINDPSKLYDEQSAQVKPSGDGSIRSLDLYISSVSRLKGYAPVAYNDLQVRGLIDDNKITTLRGGEIEVVGGVTPLGSEFLEFVSLKDEKADGDD